MRVRRLDPAVRTSIRTLPHGAGRDANCARSPGHVGFQVEGDVVYADDSDRLEFAPVPAELLLKFAGPWASRVLVWHVRLRATLTSGHSASRLAGLSRLDSSARDPGPDEPYTLNRSRCRGSVVAPCLR